MIDKENLIEQIAYKETNLLFHLFIEQNDPTFNFFVRN